MKCQYPMCLFISLKSDHPENCCKSLAQLCISKSRKVITATELTGLANTLPIIIYESIICCPETFPDTSNHVVNPAPHSLRQGVWHTFDTLLIPTLQLPGSYMMKTALLTWQHLFSNPPAAPPEEEAALKPTASWLWVAVNKELG